MRLPNGYGSVVKLSGKRRKKYNVRYTVTMPDGSRVRKSQGCFRTKREALEHLEQLNKDSTQIKRDKRTFEDVLNLWNKNVRLADTTKRGYLSYFKKYCTGLFETPYEDLKLEDFDSVLEQTNHSVFARNKLVKALRSLGTVALKYDVVQKDYTKFIDTDTEIYKEKTPFSEKEIEILWNNLDIKNVDYILMHIYTGFRPSEFIELKALNINLEDGIIIGGGKTKAGTNRKVPIHERIKPLLINKLKDGRETLFKYSYKSYRIRFNKVMEQLNMKHTPHECRHTMRTRLDNLEINSVIIDRIMGHSSSGIGQSVYTHKTTRQLKEAVNLLK